MKCTKCGFVSFDYLSECKKCGTSLAGTREALGLTAPKPAIPFFLGSLIKDHEKQHAPVEANAGENTFSSFDFGEDLDSSKFLDERQPEAAVAVTPDASVAHDSDDFNLLEISDEELDLLIEDGGGEATFGPGRTGNAGEQAAMEARTDAATKVIPNFGEREPAKDAGNLIPEFDLSSLPGLSKAGESPQQAAKVQDAAKDDEPLQIELSDKDLEALLSELEHSSSVNPKKASDPKTGTGSEGAE